MNLFELRQIIESHIPAWSLGLLILIAGLIFIFFAVREYIRKNKHEDIEPCDHSDRDAYCCLICGADLTELDVEASEYFEGDR